MNIKIGGGKFICCDSFNDVCLMTHVISADHSCDLVSLLFKSLSGFQNFQRIVSEKGKL